MSKIGRNDPCPCGALVKYKKCCGAPGKGLVQLPPQVQRTRPRKRNPVLLATVFSILAANQITTRDKKK